MVGNCWFSLRLVGLEVMGRASSIVSDALRAEGGSFLSHPQSGGAAAGLLD